jgi:hypothetical protein
MSAVVLSGGHILGASGYVFNVGSAAGVISEIVGINMLADGQYAPFFDGFPIFKNMFRQAQVGTSADYQSTPPLTAGGWPAADFQCNWSGGNTQQSWGVGGWSCGFIGTGSETITAKGSGTTITGVTHGSGGAYTTFTMTPSSSVGTSANYGFEVTVTTGGVIDVFAYPPAFSSATTVDFTSSASVPPSSAYTTDAINFYKQFAHFRMMWPNNSLYNTSQMTSSNRNTCANCQFIPNMTQTYTLSGTGTLTTVNLTAPWGYQNGNYAFVINGGASAILASVVTSGGTTTLTFPSTSITSTTVQFGPEGPPVEWWIGLANACGTLGLWINTPAWEDGSISGAVTATGEPGTYSQSILQMIGSNFTSSGNVIFEFGNENFWNGGYYCTPVLNALYAQSTGFSSKMDWVGSRLHTFANLARTYLPSGWWLSKVFQINGQQTAIGNGPFYTQQCLAAMNSRYGNVSGDVQAVAIAPYITPTIGNSDSVSLILSESSAAITSGAPGWAIEDIAVMCIPYGVQVWTYEGGFQWNEANPSAVNLGAACLNSGMTANVEQLWQQAFDFGVSKISHFGTGVWTGGGNNINDELSNNYATLIASGSPTLAALQSFYSGYAWTRNVITGSGSIVNGANYLENLTAGVYGNFALNQNAPHNQTGYCTYLVKCPAGGAGTYTLDVTFASVSGSPTTSVEVNGTVLRTGVAVSNGVVNCGSITLTAGLNYICLGQNGAQGTTAQNQITLLQVN